MLKQLYPQRKSLSCPSDRPETHITATDPGLHSVLIRIRKAPQSNPGRREAVTPDVLRVFPLYREANTVIKLNMGTTVSCHIVYNPVIVHLTLSNVHRIPRSSG
jgi:hypothetical protein